MNFDWVTTLPSVLNFTGVPILVTGIIFLFKAYQSALETNKESFRQLRETAEALEKDNSTLRARLRDFDTAVFSRVEKFDEISKRSLSVIGELEARKVALLSSSEATENGEGLRSAIAQLNEAIAVIRRTVDFPADFRQEMRSYIDHFERRLREGFADTSAVMERVGDTKSRIAIIRLIGSDALADQLAKDLVDEIARPGISLPSPKTESERPTPLLGEPTRPPTE